jgi:DNA adenine methylase
MDEKALKLPTFLKWAGGKRRIMPLISQYFPQKIDRYFEPFLGGGSVFFYVKQKYNPSLCVISDTNLDLVNAYIHIRDEPELLIKYLKKFKNKHSKEFYYNVRKSFNENRFGEIQRSAAFIYLNKTCFNGLYRVNSKNKFNVPFGQLKNPGIFEEETIYAASALLNDRVEIRHQDYKDILLNIKKGDFVYLDPCYDPLKKTSFANYTPERFSKDDRIKLYTFIEILRKRKAKVVLSNNDLLEVRKLYSKYKVNKITAPRFIGSKSLYRSSIVELVISN